MAATAIATAAAPLFCATPAAAPPLSSSRRLHFPLPCAAKAAGRCSVGPVRQWRLWERRRAVRCGAVRSIGESEFETEVLQSELPVLVDFVADWCGPCRLIAPAVQWVAQEFEGRLKVVKIDHDANPQLIQQYKVFGLPTLILFRNGLEVPNSRKEGAITKAKLKHYLDSIL